MPPTNSKTLTTVTANYEDYFFLLRTFLQWHRNYVQVRLKTLAPTTLVQHIFNVYSYTLGTLLPVDYSQLPRKQTKATLKQTNSHIHEKVRTHSGYSRTMPHFRQPFCPAGGCRSGFTDTDRLLQYHCNHWQCRSILIPPLIGTKYGNWIGNRCAVVSNNAPIRYPAAAANCTQRVGRFWWRSSL